MRRLFTKSASFSITSLSRDRVIVVTGASSGLGYEIAKWCSMMGATVIMACRSEQKTLKAIEQINQEFKAEKAKGTTGMTQSDTLALEYMHVDLSSFKSVVSFTEAFKGSGRNLHVLFLNAGIFSKYFITEDGLEAHLQVNYLSHFLMTAKLLPIIHQSGEDCRILLMSSLAHRFARFDPEAMNYTGPSDKYFDLLYYGKSKLYQVMQMFSMARRLGATRVLVNSIDPGVVYTNIDAETRGVRRVLSKLAHWFSGKSSSDAARCSIYCATNSAFAGVTGNHIVNFRKRNPSSIARDETNQDQLWEKTWEYIHEYVTEEDRAMMEGVGVSEIRE